jgi:predicted regulator of Ras-like GTPase activity (Roadblock/LC7/MglB family)
MTEPEGTEGRRLAETLEALTEISGVVGGVLAAEDGFPLATRLGGVHDREGMAAAAAAIGQLAGQTLGRLGRGALQLAVLEASRATFVVRPTSVGFLMAVAEPEADVSLIATEMRRAAAALEQAASALAGS